MEFDNRRKFHRINFDGVANVQFADDIYDYCLVKNISLTGLFIQGEFKKHRMRDCHVKLYHSEKSGINCLNGSGRIVWTSDSGVGFQFTRMTFENYMLLQSTLIEQAEQPEIILREFPENCPFEISNEEHGILQ